eukprot:3732911-Rhodomonas_salina.1
MALRAHQYGEAYDPTRTSVLGGVCPYAHISTGRRMALRVGAYSARTSLRAPAAVDAAVGGRVEGCGNREHSVCVMSV